MGQPRSVDGVVIGAVMDFDDLPIDREMLRRAFEDAARIQREFDSQAAVWAASMRDAQMKLDQLGKLLSGTDPVTNALLTRIDDATARALSQFDLPTLSMDWNWWSVERDRRRTIAAFQNLDLIPSPSVDRALVDQIVNAHEANESEDTILELVLQHFDADDCAAVAKIVDRLCISTDFKARAEVLQDALTGHRAHLDTITCYPLVAMIEGLVVPLLSEIVGGGNVKHYQIPEILEEVPASVAYAIGLEAYDCIIEYFRGHLYENFDWQKQPDKARDFINLNRHCLSHGHAARGTRLNTIRCFLVLDVMAVMLPELRREFGVGAA